MDEVLFLLILNIIAIDTHKVSRLTSMNRRCALARVLANFS